MKKNKLLMRILSILGVVVLLVALSLPCFAFDGTTWIINIYDVENESMATISVPILDDAGTVRVTYNRSSNLLVSIIAGTGASAETVYQFVLPKYYEAEFSIYCAGDDEVNGYFGLAYNNTLIDGILSPDYDEVHCTIQLHTTYVYDDEDMQTQATQFYSQGYSAGEIAGKAYVQAHPSNFGLYTESQFNNYGDARFNAGYEAGYAQGQEDVNDDYSQGYNDGLKDGKVFVGTTNVVLSNIFNIFTNFVNSTGIFGVSLIAILITALIIIIVYLIFKAVRS